MSKPKTKIIPGEGDPCPRCKKPTQIREHLEVLQSHLNQPFYYSRWFNCENPRCRTTLIMPERYRVMRTMATDDDLFERKPPATYPQTPGFKEPTTSKDAAKAMGITASKMREDLLTLYRTAWPAGLTADEAAAKIGRTVFAVRPRITELRQLGDLMPVLGAGPDPKPLRRANVSGMMATVLVCKRPT